MVSYNKSLLLIVSLFLGVSPIAATAQLIENYDSGKVKIASIMAHEETGVTAFNKKNIKYAETQNLDTDLNIGEIAKFFDCKTLIGHSFITETLKTPVSPHDKDTILAYRTQAIKALVENPELKNEVEQLLNQAHQEEQEIIKLMSEFFTAQTCPELKNLQLIKEQYPMMLPFNEFMAKSPTGKIIETSSLLIGIPTLSYIVKFMGQCTYALAKAGESFGQATFYTGYFGAFTGYMGYKLYKDYSTASEKRSKLHSLNQFIVIAEKIEKLCQKYDLQNQFKISNITDPIGSQLIESLKHRRYKNKKSYVFMVPLVHSFLYKVYEQEKHLAQILCCIAEMDAYNAIATKIIESQNTNNKFCFAHFIEQEKPAIKAQAFWNVLVDNAVPSSINEDKHIILTGPNAGGKTTAIRAILQNIVLAQTFGIAAAESFEFTMFDVIHSYLTISDDILNGLSLFASEVKRAQEIVQKIKTLEPGKKFFFALDELFTGTAAEQGEACAYEFVKRISELQGTQFIYATHFNKLKELGNDQSYCINYKVDAPTKNAHGKLVYPFTLSQGANEINVALDIAREAQLFA